MKKLFCTIGMMAAALMVTAQSIEQQAENAGNEAFSEAMIRNIMIIMGIFILTFILKSGKKKKES